ncbi:catalase [Janthinobacterium agaricidamnosum]|uniref:Catalase n=1 Tax=Janthinobacterium agaricidamnosum NBRC 102515 = DSM 9628 TaxID=1349767 RepID=W0V228_9BURK|nr:catalase [Janthinobacterium agaricidamnosum]CDG81675.1 catalase family protein [Janthinobacterium agaricidamnosum NBRC 102515 = DSM 9628]
MATNKKTPSVDGAGSILSTVSGPSEQAPPASLGGKDHHHDQHPAALLQKAVAGQKLAEAMPFNPLTAGQHGEAARVPQTGPGVTPSAVSATASTITENNASPKAGDGIAPQGSSPLSTSLDPVRGDDGGKILTTNQGVEVGDNQNSLKAGLRGPTLMEDFILREKITHFDHERIPERVVHARGSAAHGYFENYRDLAALTRAAPFSKAGKRTPVFVRFSTVAGERGSADAVRDVRGFAVKFYTDAGNWDLVGNNIPVFFIQDAIKFPDLIHAVKPEPNHGMPQAASAHDTFWDFASLSPETAHMLMWVMSDRAIPRSFRTMQGFGVHTFRLVNAHGKSVFCKFHWRPLAGTYSLVWDEALRINGADPDFHRRDLWEAIEAGAYPQYELAFQVFTEEQADAFGFDVLDATKLIPEELVPLTPVGKLTLNRNPDNFFAETEQVAFCAAHIIPGLDFSHDPLLQGRIHSYIDTQISRLGGANFHEIPINSPLAPLHNNQRDGMHRQTVNRGRVAYEPNSLAGGCPFQAGAKGFNSFPAPPDGDKVRAKPEKFADHYSQARLFWISQSAPEQNHIVHAFRFELTKVQTPAVRKRVVALLRNVDRDLAQRVADSIAIPLPPPLPDQPPLPVPDYAPSPALSLLHLPGQTGIAAHKVAILAAPGSDVAQLRTVYASLLADGAVPRVVGSRLGSLPANGNGAGAAPAVEISLETGPSVLFDGVVIADGAAGAERLAQDANALEFVRLQYRHGKPILALGAGKELLSKAGIPLRLPDGKPDPGLIIADGASPGDLARAVAAFKAALAAHRVYARETDPPLV